MQNFSISPKKMVGSFWINRRLIKALILREVEGRYRGSFMGILWSFLTPLLMLSVYAFVFGVIFRARWSANSTSNTEFVLILFAGLIVFSLFSECTNRAPGLVLANINYVKKVVFPLEILPIVALGSALFHTLISIGVWLLGYTILFGIPHVTILFLPLIIIPLMLFVLGVTWFLAALGVYLRDVSQIISSIVSMLMFLSPIFYPTNALPEKYQNIVLLSPLTLAIEQTRDVLFWGKIPSMSIVFFSFLGSAFIAWLGFVWFQKIRKGFADVI